MVQGRGYKLIPDLTWGKLDEKNRPEQLIGMYWANASEQAVVGVKGKYSRLHEENGFEWHKVKNVFFSTRLIPSQKPIEVYKLCEEICKQGPYLSLFDRWINRRHGWITVGNEVTEESA